MMHKLNHQFDLSCSGRGKPPANWRHSARKCPPRHDRLSQRRGALIIEMLVGTILLGVFLAGLLPIIAWVRLAQGTTENHRVAALELANQMERIAALPAGQRTSEQLQQLELSPEATANLTDAELTAMIDTESAFPNQQQIRLSLTWTSDNNQRVKPLQLTAWFKPPTSGPSTP